MAERLRIPAPRRERRSHAERTAETQGRIKAAVVECLAERGFHRTTAAEISRRAGVSWGAVQHHFGDKNGILIAVLEDAFHELAARLAGAPIEDEPLDKRVALFVDRAWEHIGSDRYRSVLEILLNYPLPDASAPEDLWREGLVEAWNRIWDAYFGDRLRPRRRKLALQHYTITVLSGLVTVRMLEGSAAPIRDAELAYLKDTLVRELSRAEAG
jgi:AcrR family transcriptional regulator